MTGDFSLKKTSEQIGRHSAAKSGSGQPLFSLIENLYGKSGTFSRILLFSILLKVKFENFIYTTSSKTPQNSCFLFLKQSEVLIRHFTFAAPTFVEPALWCQICYLDNHVVIVAINFGFHGPDVQVTSEGRLHLLCHDRHWGYRFQPRFLSFRSCSSCRGRLVDALNGWFQLDLIRLGSKFIGFEE